MEDNTNGIRVPRSFKFLRRKLYLNENRDQQLVKIKLKQLHFKELYDEDFQYGKKSYRYVTRKQLSCLKTLDMSFSNASHSIDMLKHCKVLKKANVTVSAENCVSCITRLSKDLEHLHLTLDPTYQEGNPFNVRGYCRALVNLRKLKTLSKSNNYLHVPTMIKENNLLNIYIPMLKDLKKFDVAVTEEGQQGLQKLMKQDQICPYVTNLSVNIDPEMLENYNAVRQMLKEENCDQDDEEVKEGQEDEDEWVEEEDEDEDEWEEEEDGDDMVNNVDHVMDEQQKQVIIKNEMSPFFKFHLFRNLKKLSFLFCRRDHYPLDSFVVEGFKSLQNLEHLSLNLYSRPTGTKYLFDGLAHLPLLTSFDLEIKVIRDAEFPLLAQFLKNQTQLVSLSLNIPSLGTRRAYQVQNFCLENAWQFFNNKPHLKYLSLKSELWNIESLSKGLEKTDLLPQLQSFEIEVFDDDVTSKSSAEVRVKGLCDFLLRQKKLLRTLKINLIFVMDATIVDIIIKTLQELEDLNTLQLHVNWQIMYAHQIYQTFFQRTFSKVLPASTKKGLPIYKNTFSHLEKALEKLTNLKQLNMNFSNLVEPRGKMGIDSSVIFKALPTLKQMQDLSLTLPYLVEASEKNPSPVSKLLELQKLRRVLIMHAEDSTLEKTCQDMNKNQTLRCDLMF